MARVRLVQGLESQICQRDVPLAFILLVTTAGTQSEGGKKKISKSVIICLSTYIYNIVQYITYTVGKKT